MFTVGHILLPKYWREECEANENFMKNRLLIDIEGIGGILHLVEFCRENFDINDFILGGDMRYSRFALAFEKEEDYNLAKLSLKGIL